MVCMQGGGGCMGGGCRGWSVHVVGLMKGGVFSLPRAVGTVVWHCVLCGSLVLG